MLAYTLEQAEEDMRRTYFFIRSKRWQTTNWSAVNDFRHIKHAMLRMGVTEVEIKAAMHCLKVRECRRCNKNGGAGFIACHYIGKRRKAGMQWMEIP